MIPLILTFTKLREKGENDLPQQKVIMKKITFVTFGR